MKPHRLLSLLAAIVFIIPSQVQAQYRSLETDALRLVYFDLASDFLVKYVARSFHNSLDVYREMYDYEPTEPVTVFIHDMGDYGNAGADVLPRNFINIRMAPLSYSFETAPANERMNSTLHHELVHVATNDHAAGSDNFFRAIFGGKVAVSEDDPLTMFYSYLTAPRRYAPRWYQEGIAVYLETWLSGGLGRSLGGYDEMAFRTRVLEDKHFFDMVGLESEGTAADFQVGVNSYLYGTRFMTYLGLQYDPQKVIDWMNRPGESKGHFTSQFRAVFGIPISQAWDEWIAYEKEFQQSTLEVIRENPVTEYREIAARPLGSMSKAYVDELTGSLVAAVNYPGTLSHIKAIDLTNGSDRKITGVTGPTLFTVCSLVYDEDSRKVFYSTNNNRWRDLVVVDIDTGEKELLIKEGRIGDLAYNKSDASVWGVRHFLGLSTLVRIPAPYDEANQIYTLDYGSDLYDIDISPNGQWLTGAFVRINGDQQLVRARVADLLDDNIDFEVLFDFETSNPEGFVFSEDGSSLYGSSYYTGVSNIMRYDFAEEQMAIITNGQTGYFRPVPMQGDSLIAFRYTTDGFQPVMIPDRQARAGAITGMGDRLVDDHPVVTEWTAPPPSSIDLDSLGYTDAPYRAFRSLTLDSVVPVVQGYEDEIAVGLKMNLSDPLGMHRLSASASVVPSIPGDSTAAIGTDERFHAALEYSFVGLGAGQWTLTGTYNRADFYDLFGPTKTSRKGYSVGLNYDQTISYEGPKKNLRYEIGVAGYFNMEKLPSFQNVVAPFTEMGQAHASLAYKNLKSSLGAVDAESGYTWAVNASTGYVNKEFYPRVSANLDLGVLLPVSHLSFWVRTSGGIAQGQPDNPFANYYFGGFRNNWVDKKDPKQFHQNLAFPGLEIDEIGGTNYAKVMAELILPPVRFRHVGGSMLFLKWARVSLFSSGIYTNLHKDFVTGSLASKRRAVNAGVQLDLQLQLFSYLKSTLSFGRAVAQEKDGTKQWETMFSLKIL